MSSPDEMMNNVLDLFTQAVDLLGRNAINNSLIDSIKNANVENNVFLGSMLSWRVVLEFYINKVSDLQEKAEDILKQRLNVENLDLDVVERNEMDNLDAHIRLLIAVLQKEKVQTEQMAAKIDDAFLRNKS